MKIVKVGIYIFLDLLIRGIFFEYVWYDDNEL